MLLLSPIKLFIFDFDGTLVLSNHIKKQSFFDVIKYRYPDISLSLCNDLKNIMTSNPNIDRYAIFNKLAQLNKNIDAKILVADYGNKCHDLIMKADKVSGSLELLLRLKELKKNVIINSATPRDALLRTVNALDIHKYIDEIYGAPASKSENIRIAMKKYSVLANQIIVIGDGDNDRIAAKDIGCLFAGIKNEYSDFKVTPKFLGNDLKYIVSALG